MFDYSSDSIRVQITSNNSISFYYPNLFVHYISIYFIGLLERNRLPKFLCIFQLFSSCVRHYRIFKPSFTYLYTYFIYIFL